ncbi:ATP-binding protein [Specibacter sp. RAF43]|uniref:ATP-binding protein n=1 Tax=Specibacter sp. RAF43 TaxID=3233057 RepID=UPI003F98701E
MQTSQASAQMIGREAELRALAASYADAVDSKPQAVVIGGEAGLGKTRLLREFLAGVAGEARIISGQCVDLGTLAPPYAPITGVLRALAAQVGLAAVVDYAGPGREALALLLPEAEVETTGRPNGNRVLEAVSTILERACADQPTVVVVEDLHWADDATLAVLRFILRAFGGGRFLLAMTYRSDEVHRGHPLRGFLAEVERGRYAKNIELSRLTKDQVRCQVESITGEPAGYQLVENVFSRSDGIPFFVEELLGLGDCDAAGELPSTLRDLLLARYERMEESVQYFLRVIAAGGVSVPHSLAVKAFDRPAADLEPAARTAQLANLLRLDGNAYAFRHALVREAIHADLLPGERTRFHTRYAEAIESADNPDAVEIAYHWHAANLPEKTFHASIAAMVEAEGSYAYTTAARMGERALELWDRIADGDTIAGMPRFALMARTAAAHNLAGDSDRSLAVIRLAVADPAAAGPDLARLLADQARYLGFNAQAGSVPLLLRALDLTPSGTEENLRASLLNRLAARYMLEARLEQAVEVATEALGLAASIGNAAESSIASNLRGVSRIMAGEVAGGKADLQAAEPLAEGNPEALLRFRINYSDSLHLLGLYDESIRVAEDGIERARALGVERTTGAMLSSNAVEPLFARGDWARARALLERNLALSPPGAFQAYLMRSKIWSTLWGGDPEAAQALFRDWQPLLRDLSSVEMQSRLHLVALGAELAWARGDLDGAWREACFILGPGFRPLPGYDLPLLVIAARILAARRRDSEAFEGAAGAEPQLRTILARQAFWPTHRAWSALFDAELGGPAGTGTDPGAWEWAGTFADSLPSHLRFYMALRRSQADLAAGHRPEALAALRAAIKGAEDLGAGLIAQMGREFANRTGLPLTGTLLRPHAEDLTARESQVLALVAGGLTNRQIGAELFISAKTVSVHVSAVMRKLGAATRTEAATRARTKN